jgi:hypothetical protein
MGVRRYLRHLLMNDNEQKQNHKCLHDNLMDVCASIESSTNNTVYCAHVAILIRLLLWIICELHQLRHIIGLCHTTCQLSTGQVRVCDENIQIPSSHQTLYS